MKNKYYCGKCEHIGMYTGSYTHSEKLCKRYAAILKVDGNDVEKCVPCICETLETENAALRERLSKAVELPCKVGDKVYIPWVWDNQSGIMEAPVITIRLYPYIRKYEIRLETDSLNFAQKYHYGNFNDKDFGTLIFTTREAAEARLKDLQGGKQ